jgi:hypothetical protein
MAALAHLRFSRGGHDEALARHLEPTIKWLLENQLIQGGWPYDWTNPPHAIGFLSTASSICSLCLFMDLGQSSKRLQSQIRSAVRKGYDGLLRAQRQAIWNGDGAPDIYQILDSAFALRLLRLADRNGTLSALKTPNQLSTDDLVVAYCANALADGWPDNVAHSHSSAVTSLSALQLVLESGNPAGLAASFLSTVEATILAAWDNGSLSKRLTAWDWQCLAILGSIMAGPLPERSASSILERSERIRRKWLHGTLQSRDIKDLNENAKAVLIFALTSGEGFKPGALAQRIRDFPKTLVDVVIQNLLWAALVALGGAIVSYFTLS